MERKKKLIQSTEYTVEAGCTLLPFLLEHVKGKSRNTVKGLLARRQVLVNGKAVGRFDHLLRPGQTVSILPPPEYRPVDPPFPVLFEDDDLIAIDKPAGLLSMANEKEREHTAYHMLTDYMRDLKEDGRVFIIHRLDRDTSGALLFAKNEDVKLAFQDDWEHRVSLRRYLAVVQGRPPEEQGTCRSWLKETSTHLVYSVEKGTGGKEAITHYRVLDAKGEYSLLEVDIDTGRKNQIRVHLADLGCPVSGDKQYGAGRSPLGRLGLHASELVLTDPRTGGDLNLLAPTPREFKKLFRAQG